MATLPGKSRIDILQKDVSVIKLLLICHIKQSSDKVDWDQKAAKMHRIREEIGYGKITARKDDI